MKPKSVVSAALLIFVGASVVWLVVSESAAPSPEPSAEPEETSAAPVAAADNAPAAQPSEEATSDQSTVIAYYFHRTQRCPTCRKIEAYSSEALKEAFPDAFESGRIEWRTVNLDESQHEHFVKEFELSTGGLVLVRMNGQDREDWVNLDRVWELVGDELKFKAYVEAGAMPLLEETH